MKTYNHDTITELIHKAQNCTRKRSHLNIHDDLNEEIQRLLIAIEPESYVRPHFHPEVDKKELIILIKGSCACLTFNSNGEIRDSFILNADNPLCEFPPQTWHSLISLETATVITEIKKGPYKALAPENFASWAPQEGELTSQDYLNSLKESILNEK